MTDGRDWDEFADDQREWAEPTEVQGSEKAESVVSVRLPTSVMREVRANARARGVPVSAYVRSLISRGLASPAPSECFGATLTSIEDSITRFVTGTLRAPRESPSFTYGAQDREPITN